MMRKKSLRQRFPDQFVFRIKVWTKTGASLEVDGPASDLAGELLMAISVRAHPEGEQVQIMEKCLKELHATQKRRTSIA